MKMVKVCRFAASWMIGMASFAGPVSAESGSVEPPRDKEWVTFHFDDGLAPSGGAAAQKIRSSYQRESSLQLPGLAVFEKDEPCLVEGHQGKGLYFGDSVRNLLPRDLSEMDLNEEGLSILQTLESAKVSVDRSGAEALFGKTCLVVETGEAIRAGVSIPFQVPGGKYEKTADHIYVFSVFIKGQGKVNVELATDKGRCDFPKSLNLDATWRRVTFWLASSEPASAQITFRNFTGHKTRVLLDGLQLEWKRDVHARITGKRHETPSGMEFSAGPWVPGGESFDVGSWILEWTEDDLFPIAEGTVNFWIRPLFCRMDAQDHPVFEVGERFYRLLLAKTNTFQFFRRSAEDSLEVARPDQFNLGEWSMVTVTWSNEKKEICLYFNGRKVGVRKSDRIELKTDMKPEEKSADPLNPKRIQIGSASGGVASDGTTLPNIGLNAVIDDLTVYSVALDERQVLGLGRIDDE